jgi:predicted anti-sigma-YlaC factor YlaD
MHRVIRDHLEEVLAESHAGRGPSQEMESGLNRTQDFELHLRQCEECRIEIDFMRRQAALLRELRSEAEYEPPPGFYARVIGRIDKQRAGSIWNVFSESPFGRRIAIASMTLALVFGVYLIASERYVDQPVNAPVQISDTIPGEDQPGLVLGSEGVPDRDAVLVNLVTYREQ